MKIIIIGAGPCGLGAAWRTEEVIRQGKADISRKQYKREVVL
jgi:protoporphyrinogen oxidase